VQHVFSVSVIARRTEHQQPLRSDDNGGLRLRQGVAVAAVGASLPEQVVGNAEIESRLGLTEAWIERRTGIRSRRIADSDETLTGHATVAAARALAAAEVDAEQVDLVLVATTTADAIMPNAAPLVAGALGATRAGAYDVGAACSGFLSAIAAGASWVESGRGNCVLVVGADLMSRVTDPMDRSTAAVFADGAGAVVLTGTDGDSRIGPLVLRSDASGADHIRVPRRPAYMTMAGHETFKAAVARLSESTLEAVASSGLTLDEIDLFVYHQANGRILTAVGERLGISNPHRVVDCIAEHGNTSAATLPLALAHSVEHGRLHDGDRVLLGAFGAGFTWGATVIEWGRE
jgi:3-oxoacyl-[acyl-carrier-protein] synthase III